MGEALHGLLQCYPSHAVGNHHYLQALYQYLNFAIYNIKFLEKCHKFVPTKHLALSDVNLRQKEHLT
jgi:hypothetical protein